MDNASDFLVLRDVKKWFPVQQGLIAQLLARGKIDHVRAVDGVSLVIRKGEVFGLAGESGSGKSTLGRLALRLLEPTEGQVFLDGIELVSLGGEELRRLRRRMQMIFQDPLASMNPRMTIGQAIAHPLEIHFPQGANRRKERVLEMLEQVGLSPATQFYDKYPHQISGGQRQRVVVARALVTQPDFVVADEPIAMADVSVRALLLDLMKQLIEELNLTYLFITHDLSTAKHICQRIGIMYLGKMVEVGPLASVYGDPVHPYTEALLSAVPVPDPVHRRTTLMPRGEIPNPINPPPGCRYHPRCPIAQSVCQQEIPEMLPISGQLGHSAACHLRSGRIGQERIE